MREPPFWWRDPGMEALALAPLAAIYGALAGRRISREGWHAGVPVVCVGNPIVGGAGKTPLVLAIGEMLRAQGQAFAFLSRGYGGQQSGPCQVDPARHRAIEVGDEPRLLARVAPTIVARDRIMGAAAATAGGACVIVMDDGFQSPSLHKDFSILVIDARRGLGNGHVIPAGPLRAPLDAQLDHADALVLVGKSSGELSIVAVARKRRLPVFTASLVPDPTFVSELGSSRVLAFAGIGDPEKFFGTLGDAGVSVVRTRSFADHHRYSRAEARRLCEHADREKLVLVTTEKDMARIEQDEQATELADRARALPVRLEFEDEARFRALLLERIAHAQGGPSSA